MASRVSLKNNIPYHDIVDFGLHSRRDLMPKVPVEPREGERDHGVEFV